MPKGVDGMFDVFVKYLWLRSDLSSRSHTLLRKWGWKHAHKYTHRYSHFHTHVCTPACVHMYVRTYIRPHSHTHTPMYTRAPMHAHAYKKTHIHKRILAPACTRRCYCHLSTAITETQDSMKGELSIKREKKSWKIKTTRSCQSLTVCGVRRVQHKATVLMQDVPKKK